MEWVTCLEFYRRKFLPRVNTLELTYRKKIMQTDSADQTPVGCVFSVV